MRFRRLALVLLDAAVAVAQQYAFVPVSNSPKTINRVFQDRGGRLWLGTLDDLVMFDGVRFYSLHDYGYPATPSREIAEDDEGGIWSASGLGVYRFHDGQVSQVFAGNSVNIAMLAPGVMLAAVNPPGDPKSGTPEYQLIRIRRESSGWTTELLPGPTVITGFALDKAGAALFVCAGGWCELSRRAILDWHAGAVRDTFHKDDNNFSRVYRDRFGCLWLRSSPFTTYTCPGGVQTRVPDDIASLSPLAFLAEAADGSMILPSSSSLAVGRPGAFHVARSANGMPGNDLPTIAADGTIWIGSDENGLVRLASPFHLEYWTARDGLETPLSITRAGDHVFEGSPQGIRMLSEDRSRWTLVPHSKDRGLIVQVLPGPDRTLYAVGAQITQIRYDGTVVAEAIPGAGRSEWLPRPSDGGRRVTLSIGCREAMACSR